MYSWNALTPEQIAQYFVTSKGGPRALPKTATALYESVQQYLRSNRLGHRLNEAAEIATCAFEVAQEAQMAEAELQPVATPEQTAWANDQSQGIGDRLPDEAAFRQADERLLGAQVRAMSMPEFAASRERLGLAQNLASFLGGND